jgi:hypothetical protein
MKADRSEMKVDDDWRSGHKEWGNMDVSWNKYHPIGIDPSPLFKGLPDNLCQCPHWGYVIKGSIRIKYKDYDEVIREGEVYYMQPGHIPEMEEDCEIIEFSPKKEYQEFLEVLNRNETALRNDSK